jgi:hypothetical protein
MRFPLRAGERGGVAILLAFGLLALMAAAAFATGNNVIRELALGGEAVQGARAASAADAGLDWFLAWAAGAGGGRAEPPPDLPADGAAGLFTAPGDTLARQGFALRVQPLGPLAQPGMGRREAAWGRADPESLAPDQLWRVTATGRCELLDRPGPADAGRPRQVFRQVRELLVTAAQGSGAPATDPR